MGLIVTDKVNERRCRNIIPSASQSFNDSILFLERFPLAVVFGGCSDGCDGYLLWILAKEIIC